MKERDREKGRERERETEREKERARDRERERDTHRESCNSVGFSVLGNFILHSSRKAKKSATRAVHRGEGGEHVCMYVCMYVCM